MRNYLTARSAARGKSIFSSPKRYRSPAFHTSSAHRALIEPLEARHLLSATVIEVNTFQDIVDPNDAFISLREAILAANASPEDNEIHLPAGTYMLTRQGANEDAGLTGDLDIVDNGSLWIWAPYYPGARIDASGLYDANTASGDRIFDVHPNANVTFEYLELTQGNSDTSGGAVRVNEANASLVRTVVKDNAAQGNGGGVSVSPGSSLSLLWSTFSGNSAAVNGGAIYSQAQLQDDRSRFTDNSARQGGAVYHQASEEAVITGTTFIGNSAIENGGAIAAFGPVTLEQTVLGTNTAAQGGAIYGLDTHLSLLGGTVSGNGADRGAGLMSVRGSVMIDGTLMAGNVAVIDGGAVHASGELRIVNATLTGNLAQNRGGAIAWTTRQDSPLTASLEIDNSRILLNQAKDAGGLLAEMRDDVLEEWNAVVKNSTFSENRATGDGGAILARRAKLSILDCSLGENAAGYNGGALRSLGSRISIERSTFTGNEAAFGGGGIHHEQGPVFDSSRALLKIAASEFTHNRGRALYSRGWVEVTTSSFTENLDGAIELNGFPATIADSVISRNTAPDGAGIYAQNGLWAVVELGLPQVFQILRTTISNNVATGFGGGGVMTSSSMLLEDCIIADNVASSTVARNGLGAGVLFADGVYNHSLVARRSAFVGNVATGNGGAIAALDGRLLQIVDSSFNHNSAANGGAVHVERTTSDILDSEFTENSATQSGGAIYANAAAHITHSSFSENSATNGGAVAGFFSQMSTSTLVNNIASQAGGGVYALGGTIRGSSLSGNEATSGGGAYFERAGVIDSSTISGNSAVNGGGVFSIAQLEIANSTLSGNEAFNDGGGLYAGGNLTIRSSTVTLNRAEADGDGAGQGGGVALAGAATRSLENTILAGNVAGTANANEPNDIAIFGGILSSASSFNLIGDPSSAGGLAQGVNGNIVGDGLGGPRAIATVLETSLADNGGPTLTHALLTGSPAVDTGNPNFDTRTIPFDQRRAGYDRVAGAQVDIGAVEYGSDFESFVAGRHLYYEYSSYDLFVRGINILDFDAIDPIKQALLADGMLSDSANVTSYSRGINGIMVDLAGSHPDITADDFIFRMGVTNDPASWAAAPAPSAIQVYAGQGLGGADRIVITWPDGAIKNTYLQVIVAANEDTGLADEDVFFFGNRVSDSFSTQPPASFVTSAADELAARYATPKQGLDVSNPFDFDKSGTISSADMLIARNNPGILPRIRIAPQAAASPLAVEATAIEAFNRSSTLTRVPAAAGNAIASALPRLAATPPVDAATNGPSTAKSEIPLEQRLIDRAVATLWDEPSDSLASSTADDVPSDDLTLLEDVILELTLLS